jgi:hypothetical protein
MYRRPKLPNVPLQALLDERDDLSVQVSLLADTKMAALVSMPLLERLKDLDAQISAISGSNWRPSPGRQSSAPIPKSIEGQTNADAVLSNALPTIPIALPPDQLRGNGPTRGR